MLGYVECHFFTGMSEKYESQNANLKSGKYLFEPKRVSNDPIQNILKKDEQFRYNFVIIVDTPVYQRWYTGSRLWQLRCAM